MPLKPAEIERFKERLEEMRKQMSHLLRESTEDVKATDQAKGYSQHQADEGTDDFNRTISLQVSNEELQVLRQIERALEKVGESTYGICDVTGEEIPIKRLEAIPYATMTVKAQEKFEKGLI